MNSNAAYPCDGCADRVVGCHAACERYLAARAAADAQREAERQKRTGDKAAVELLTQGALRSVRRKK
jgi:hypothetical protein